MAKRKSDSDKDDALLPSDILESSPKAKVQCLIVVSILRSISLLPQSSYTPSLIAIFGCFGTGVIHGVRMVLLFLDSR